jgi:hypothetical protein
MAALVAADREGVSEYRGAVRGGEGGLSTSVWSTYRRLTWNSPAGRIEKCPPAGSRRRQNTDGPSKRGKHSQSTEPYRLAIYPQ